MNKMPIDERFSFSSDLEVLATSHSRRMGSFLIPAWFGRGLWCSLGLLLSARLIHSEPRWVWLILDRFPWSLTPDGRDVLAMFAGAAGLMAMIILAMLVKKDRCPEVWVRPNGIHAFLDGKPAYRILWKDLEVVPLMDYDIGIFIDYSQDSSPHYFRFWFKGGQEVDLPINLHPAGRNWPGFTNILELRRAMLLSLLKARPDFRVQGNVFMICRTHPSTLEVDRYSTFATSAAGGFCTLVIAISIALCFFPFVPWSQVLPATGVLGFLALGAWRWASQFDLDPENRNVKIERLKRLAGFKHKSKE